MRYCGTWSARTRPLHDQLEASERRRELEELAAAERDRPLAAIAATLARQQALTRVSVPSPFGALILKAAAYQTDSRNPGRHLQDAAVLL